MVSRKRIFLNAERDRLVTADDPDAAVLFCGVGANIEEPILAAHGLTMEEFEAVNDADDLAAGESPAAPGEAKPAASGAKAEAKAKAQPEETKAVTGPKDTK